MSARELAQISESSDSLVERLLAQMLYTMHTRPSEPEKRSWKASLPVLAADLMEAGLGNVEVLIEYALPLTSKRVDAILAGTHPETGAPSYIIIELKQWSEARLYEDDPELVSVPGVAGPRTHPVRQVSGYRRYLANYLRVLEGKEEWIRAAAYLHNATSPHAIEELESLAFEENCRLFSAASRGRFHDFLRENLSGETSGVQSADTLLGSAVAPSTQLLKVAADEIKHQEQFVLLGEQQLAVDMVLHEVKRAQQSNHKRVLVISGGPGSGKSVIALSLLGELARQNKTVLHATGSRSFTTTLRKVAGFRNRDVQSLFKYFNQFTDAEPNSLDVLIADEAHRIRETSNNRYTPKAKRSTEPQVNELINAARVPVFLLDENQVVRHGEMGSIEEITQHAESLGLEVHHISLGEQFRCGGSAPFVDWVQQILGLTDEPPAEASLPASDPFHVEVVDSPWELERLLSKKFAEGYSARMSAGYCWPWSDAEKGADELYPDIQIGDWARPWNSKEERRVGEAPPSALWATQAGGFGQVGCVYTAQGFEYDWSGVILGPDILWRDGRFVTDRSANKDPGFRFRKQVPDELFDELVRHIYKVLLTRGMIGTYIYSSDAETRDALRQLLNTK
ncbi:DUF2075 domain-containing protein [Corynebacterium occultum]|nr:DUF2075 domain-containing protein [Corynebacterium occultum]